MVYKIKISPLAAIEIIEAYDWNESQREGLGFLFLTALEIFQATLLRNPDTYSYYEKLIRQGVLKRFPYTIVYEVFDATIVIYSAFMHRQSPENKKYVSF